MNNKSYSNKRITTAIAVSIALFIVVVLIADAHSYYGLEGKHFAFAIFAAFLVHVILIPKILWQFILDRVRELGKAMRGED